MLPKLFYSMNKQSQSHEKNYRTVLQDAGTTWHIPDKLTTCTEENCFCFKRKANWMIGFRFFFSSVTSSSLYCQCNCSPDVTWCICFSSSSCFRGLWCCCSVVMQNRVAELFLHHLHTQTHTIICLNLSQCEHTTHQHLLRISMSPGSGTPGQSGDIIRFITCGSRCLLMCFSRKGRLRTELMEGRSRGLTWKV